jgi:uncharacterized protein YoxC
MTKNKSDTIKILEVIDTLVIPPLEEVGKDVKSLKSDVKVLKEDVKVLKGDVKVLKDDVNVLKDDVSDLQATTNRIETLVKSEIKYVDDLSERVIKLEKSKA